MPLILRKIRKAKWYKGGGVPWLAENDLQADALGDLLTKGNRLSIYLVDDEYTNLEQIVTALAANCDYISDFDFALFNEEALQNINIKLESTEGDTPDATVNSWHGDLVELTADKVIALATVIWTRAEKRRFLSKRILELVVKAVASQQIDRARLKKGLMEKIDPLIISPEAEQ